jgi:hypothetical protein
MNWRMPSDALRFDRSLEYEPEPVNDLDLHPFCVGICSGLRQAPQLSNTSNTRR